MNNIQVESKIDIKETTNSDGTYFINGFLVEDGQKLKFFYKSSNLEDVQKFQMLSKDSVYKIFGSVSVKYKRNIYTAVDISHVEDLKGNLLIQS